MALESFLQPGVLQSHGAHRSQPHKYLCIARVIYSMVSSLQALVYHLALPDNHGWSGFLFLSKKEAQFTGMRQYNYKPDVLDDKFHYFLSIQFSLKISIYFEE